VTSPDEITRTAGRLKDALGAAADVMTVGDRPVRARRPMISHAWKWLVPSAAAAIVLAEVLAGHPAGDTLAGGPFTQVYSSDGEVNVAAPDPAVLNGPGQQAAEGSVVKIQGSAPECGQQREGSGFVYAPPHVLTVAHVVAGTTQGQAVTTAGGVTYHARVRDPGGRVLNPGHPARPGRKP
jgi:hypothetical protein